jgi:SAM-dependent methyltransferase
MSLNYRFILKLAAKHCPPPARLLDFGCGAGEVVDLALQAGFDSWGIDTFDDVWEQYGHAAGKSEGRIIHTIAGEPLPFDDQSFDIVVSNQVFEHIEDPRPVVREVARVLRRRGLIVAMFPTREVIIEPHLRAPFVHWFRTGSTAQKRFLRLWHVLRLCNAPDLPRDHWVEFEMESLRRRIFYRNERNTLAMFAPSFQLVARGEADFIADRVLHSRALRWCHPLLAQQIFEPIVRWACMRLAGVVLVLRASATSEPTHGAHD